MCSAGVLLAIWDAQLSLRHTPITVTLLIVLAQALNVGVDAAACGAYPCARAHNKVNACYSKSFDHFTRLPLLQVLEICLCSYWRGGSG